MGYVVSVRKIVMDRNRPCKVVLLTLFAPRGVTDLYLSWGINIEHARKICSNTCGIEHQHPYRRFNSPTPYDYKWNITQACAMSVSDVSPSLQSWVSTTHRSYSQLTFLIFYKKLKNVSCEYDRVNGWNSTLQAAWYIRYLHKLSFAYYTYFFQQNPLVGEEPTPPRE